MKHHRRAGLKTEICVSVLETQVASVGVAKAGRPSRFPLTCACSSSLHLPTLCVLVSEGPLLMRTQALTGLGLIILT